MKNEKVIIAKPSEIEGRHQSHGDYEHTRRLILPAKGNQCTVTVMEIPPGKAAYPYHYHVGITEVFYIISGKGRLETPDGEKEVVSGDVVVFPPGEEGGHKIWNTSASEKLLYVDFDTTAASNVVFYPHSNKVGMLLNGRWHSCYRESDQAGYYDGE
jgi:uncharacterized cupin superfamily protein